MKDLSGVCDVFAGKATILHVKENVEPNEKEVRAALAKHGVKLRGFVKDDKYLL